MSTVQNILVLGGGTLLTTASLSFHNSLTLTANSTLSTATATTFNLSGALTGDYTLTKAGAGTLTFSRNNSASNTNSMCVCSANMFIVHWNNCSKFKSHWIDLYYQWI